MTTTAASRAAAPRRRNGHETASPNHESKRRAIVDAARDVLLREGLAGCTARAVAEASPLTKSAIHYYFGDMDEIIDRAVTDLTAAFMGHLRGVAAQHQEPNERFWATIEAYLDPFTQHRSVTLLWFDYWTACARRGDLAAVERIHAMITALFAAVLADAGVDDPAERAHALLSYALGTVMQQTVRRVAFADLRREIAAVCGIDVSPRSATRTRPPTTRTRSRSTTRT